MNPDRSRVRIEAHGGSPDQAMAMLPPLYEGATWSSSVTDRSYSYHYAAVGDDAMTLRTSRMHGRIRGDIPPGDDYVVQWITRGRAIVDAGRDEIPLHLGRPQLFPAHRAFVFDFADYDQRLVHLNRARVDEMAYERHGIAPGTVRFDHRRTPTAAASGLWSDTVALASRALERGEVNDLLWHEITRMTATAFLELYAPAPAEPEAVRLDRGARIRRVVEHIHAHADGPLTPTDLARAAEMSVRSLQESFAQHVGEAPMSYVRGVRLERVRAELAQSTPECTTVADVARRWGFAHLGRFAVEYRRRFGERPSDTLRG